MPIDPTIQSTLSSDMYFLITCSQTDLSETEITWLSSHITAKSPDFSSITGQANAHGVIPLVYKTLKDLQEQHKIDDTLLRDLKSLYTHIAQRNILMSAELLRLIKLFKEYKIKSLAFKGPSLSQMAYDDITLRQFGDIDILIQKKDRYKMMDLLLQENYLPEIDLKKSTKKTFFDTVNVIGFHNPSTGVYIENHWELLSKNYAIDWDEKTLWDKQDTTLINQKEVPVLRLEQLLLYLCAHGAKHLFERLEWICDIDRSIRANPNVDWSYLLQEAEKLGIKRMLLLGLSLSQTFFGLKLPKIITQEMSKDSALSKLTQTIIGMHFSSTPKSKKSYSSFGLLLKMRENLFDKFRFTYRGLFTPKFDDFKFIQLPKYLVFLYIFIRPYRLITKYFKL